MRDHPEARCPFLVAASGKPTTNCAWPSRLSLQLDDRGGRFIQEWRIDDERGGFAELPGGGNDWPLEVTVDNKASPVIEHNGGPAVPLARGSHSVAGKFEWKALPESLPLPAGVGLLDLTRNGRSVAFPDLDPNGALNLQRQAAAAPEENRLTTTVTRLLDDQMPFAVTTQVQLQVTGHSREEVLGPALLPGTFAVSLASGLPARLESDGRLKVQVRQGTWTIEIRALENEPVKTLGLPSQLQNWPADEVWAFEAQNQLRAVQLSGLPEVDPERTHLPEAWKHFPAYRAVPGAALRLDERRRGDPDPAPDTLALTRSLWLDFDGQGYTVHDELSGEMHRGWRLSLAAPAALGHASVNGHDQLVTSDSSGNPGIEVRQGKLAIEADSRLVGDVGHLPAIGWTHDMKKVALWLNLPPGWHLFHAFGVDSVGDDFITEWTLLDFFVLLITGIAAGRLFGPNVGLLALVTLGLTFHESDSPKWLWLVLIAVQAALRLLRGGRLQLALRIGRVACVVALGAVLIPFAVGELRAAIYPQLEHREQESNPFLRKAPLAALGGAVAPTGLAKKTAVHASQKDRPAPAEEPTVEPAEAPAAEAAAPAPPPAPRPAPMASRPGSHGGSYSPQSYADLVDSTAVVQTGPGLPTWQWRGIPLRFAGPVPQGYTIKLWLIPPLLNRLLCLARVLLAAALLAVLLGVSRERLRHLWAGIGRGAGPVAAALVFLFASAAARADFPDSAMLQSLGERLTTPPLCQPSCASLQSLHLAANGSTLSLAIVADAAADVAIPLPGAGAQWRPTKVTVDNQTATLRREDDGYLWVALTPGIHHLSVEGPLPQRETVQLALPLRPHQVTTSLTGWTIAGLDSDGSVAADLQLSRTAPATRGAETDQPGLRNDTLPPFARVERTLQLGLTWSVHTKVSRESPAGTALLLGVPLLPGESVITGEVRVTDKKAQIDLGPNDASAEFESKLDSTSPLVLTAPAQVPWSETWRLDASPIWHAESSGLSPIHEQAENGQRLPEWRPWPGERVTLSLTRPAAVPGQSVTIDSSNLEVHPGERQTDVTLSLDVRTSRGGQQKILLPPGAKIDALSVNDKSQPVPPTEGGAIDVPLSPGRQPVELRFNLPQEVGIAYRTPPIGLSTPSVNAHLSLEVPRDRWILWVHGPPLGPAVLFWGTLLALLLVAAALGRFRFTPLRTFDWFLLGIGFTQTPLVTAVIVAGFFLVLGLRGTHAVEKREWFNLLQVVLAFWAFAAASALVDAVSQGLLGSPEMQITGNDSYGNQLSWFTDRTAGPLPTGLVLSLPTWVYRAAMLCWALWLATACLRWVSWMWRSFTAGGLWKPRPRIEKPTLDIPPIAPPSAPNTP